MQRLKNWQLFAVCVLTWATTWHAVTYQITPIAPEVAVALRFGLAGALVLLVCLWQGRSLRFPMRTHALLAFQGAFLYGVSYLCVYYAERHVASGLVAVGYSASPLITGLGARVLFGIPIGLRFVMGGVLGLAGVALIFLPEFGKTTTGGHVALGAAFTVASVFLSAVGSLAASRNIKAGLPFWPALGFGMLYGGVTSLLIALGRGQSFGLPSAASWWFTLLYLILAGSVLTFACFLTLQDRIGPGPTGSIGVMTPILALIVSIVLEGFRPDLFTAAGASLAVLGNALMLRPGRRTSPRVSAAGPGQVRWPVARPAEVTPDD
ncbi:MAG: DMT family transporter [Caldimonas sp.]